MDVTVINPLQQRLIRQAATSPGHALNIAYNRKMDQSGEACRKENMVFLPLPMETLGGWHEQTVKAVKKLACSSGQADRRGSERHDASSGAEIGCSAGKRKCLIIVKQNAKFLQP